MTDEYELQLVANGNGVQPYLGRDLLDDSACPLAQNQRVRAQAIPDVGIILVDRADRTDYSKLLDRRATDV